MKDKDLTEALKNIIEKELKIFSKLIPKDAVKNIVDSIFPQIEKIVEQSGYVKKTKYENLKRIIDNLEERISDLEKN
jgi:polyhydroxyalkanoate synthesis regulator phasin